MAWTQTPGSRGGLPISFWMHEEGAGNLKTLTCGGGGDLPDGHYQLLAGRTIWTPDGTGNRNVRLRVRRTSDDTVLQDIPLDNDVAAAATWQFLVTDIQGYTSPPPISQGVVWVYFPRMVFLCPDTYLDIGDVGEIDPADVIAAHLHFVRLAT